jgi:sigma-B regulation protein RsbU (phosphoserine phosphatase)
MIADATFDDEAVTLEPGDRLYFYTDGVIEALNGSEQEFGHTRLMTEIDRLRDQPLRQGLDVIADLVVDWAGGQLRDDASLLAVERTG